MTVGSICFVVYISVAAVNMGLQTLYSTKEYFSAYLTLPAMKTVLGQAVPKPVTDLRDTIQKELLDRIINWKFSFVMPLSGEKGSPSISAMVSNSAAAISLCMMLSCAPAVLALMQNGPSKGDAEAVANTMGTALGIHYLVGKAKRARLTRTPAAAPGVRNEASRTRPRGWLPSSERWRRLQLP